jgi:putative transposase
MFAGLSNINEGKELNENVKEVIEFVEKRWEEINERRVQNEKKPFDRFEGNKKYLGYNFLDALMQPTEPYKIIGSNCSQQTLKLLDQNWRSFFGAIKEYSKNKDKFLGRPKLPKYKPSENGKFVLTISNTGCKIKDGYLQFSMKALRDFKFKTKCNGKLMQVRFIPRNKQYVLEIVYNLEVPEVFVQTERIIGIDIGIDNLATISSNVDVRPIIINGKPLKSINQYYNKKSAELKSDLKKKHDKDWSNRLQRLTDKRNNKIKDYIHKASKKILDYCLEHQIDTIIIGHNKNWKQEVEMGKRNNQNFVSIPFNMLISQVEYKAQNHGIKVIQTEESYTSGTSFLDGDLPTKEYYNKSRRIHRGLFQSNNNIIINADLNGSYQIIKKVVPDAFINGIEGVGLHPVRVNLI